MKRLFFSLLLFISFFAGAQAPDLQAFPDTVHVSLTAYQHAVVIAYMQDKGEVQRARYVDRMMDSIEIVKDSLGRNVLKSPTKMIKYAAPVTFLEDVFLLMGSQQERLVASDNRAIQQSLQAQLYPRRIDVLQRIGALVQSNGAQHDQVIQVNAIDYLQKRKE